GSVGIGIDSGIRLLKEEAVAAETSDNPARGDRGRHKRRTVAASLNGVNGSQADIVIGDRAEALNVACVRADDVSNIYKERFVRLDRHVAVDLNGHSGGCVAR